MPDEQPTQTVTLAAGDWQIIRAALYKLPIEMGLATLQRFEQALAQPPEPQRAVPKLVEGADG